jgi:predicted  nucleic acid-binding Zn-ribbon protein
MSYFGDSHVASSTSSAMNMSVGLGAANYPPHEPVFIVPSIPELTKVPEFNKHLNTQLRPPPPGYDMKTLRKQLESLHAEIDERTVAQQLLYRQNEELWNYTQTLMEANKINVSTMQSHIQTLHSELSELHGERKALAEKLQLQSQSNDMLKQLDADIQQLKIANTHAESFKQQAEFELRQANTQRLQLEQELSHTQREMSSKHSLLDVYRADRQDEESLTRAEVFFASSKCVLRSAYARFKLSVYKNIRLSKIRAVFESVYRRYLLQTHVWLWRRFLNRRRIMHANDSARAHEVRDECFDKWKLFVMLEKLRKGLNRKNTLSKYFGGWKKLHTEERWERQAQFKVRCVNMFVASSVIFLIGYILPKP